MKLEVKEIKNSEAHIFIKLESKEFEPHLESSFKEEVKKVEADGFRKGKMPKNTFLKKYGEESLYPTAIDFALNDVYPKLVADNKLNVIAAPDFDWAKSKIDKDGFEIEGKVALMPEVTLGDYAKIRESVKKDTVKVTKKEIDEEIEKALQSKATLELKKEQVVADGNTVIFDFNGKVDGKEFDGGKAENYELVIGSNSFIPGFETQLIGTKAGEDKDVKVTFPEDYHAEDLKGKEAVFECKVHEVKELNTPKLSKELIKELAPDVKDEDAYNDKVKQDITSRKEQEVEQKYRTEVFGKIIEDAKVEVPKSLIDQETNATLDQFKNQIAQQGMDFNMYTQMLGMTEEDMRKDMDKESERKIQEMLIITKVQETEDFKISKKDVDTKVKEMKDMYNMEEEKILELVGGKERLEQDLKYEKAYKHILGN
ncbi:MAG: trigger factor [Mycoplasmatales bacterium]